MNSSRLALTLYTLICLAAASVTAGCQQGDFPAQEASRQEASGITSMREERSLKSTSSRAAPPELSEEVYTVERIVDGDTFELGGGKTIRLIGIDTPEKHMSGKLRSDAERSGHDIETIQAMGEAASAEAQRLGEGRRVRLEYDQNNAARGHKGAYGRILAYVWVVDSQGEPAYMVNRELVANGYANAYLKYPSTRGERFRTIERQARQEGRGLWADGNARETGPAAPEEVSTEDLPYDPAGADRNCGDFDSQHVAQAFFDAAAEATGQVDPHNLNGNGDGKVCTSL